MERSKHRAAVLLTFAALLACKKASKPSPADAPESGPPPPAVSAPASTQYVSARDLERVCGGEALGHAKAYDTTSARLHPTAVFARAHDKGAFEQALLPEFDAWKAPENSAYELVACVTTTATTKVKVCEFEPKEPQGSPRSLELQDASYELAIYETKTAKLVAKKSVDLKIARSCPAAAFFKHARETKRPEYASELVKWGKQYVTTKAR